MLQDLFGFRGQPLPLGRASRVPTITAQEVARRLEQSDKTVLLDVRTTHEYAHDGHIPGARLLPLASLVHRLNEIPRDREIVCVCRSGNRSQGACEMLMARGYENVLNLEGGMIAWRRAGLPLSE
jgi:rhodanese-related sulfurtransferase